MGSSNVVDATDRLRLWGTLSMRARFRSTARFQLVFIVLFGLKALACATPLAPPLPGDPWNASPPFYRVTGGSGAELYIAGTIHLGPKAGWAFPENVNRALESASTLVLEADLEAATEEVVGDAILRHALLSGTTPLSTLISSRTAELIEQYDGVLSDAGMPHRVREALKPWYIAINLIQITSSRTDYQLDRSADAQFMQIAGDLPLIGLESPAEALATFDKLSFEVQEAILQDTLLRWDEAPESLEDLVRAWRQNDDVALARLARDGVEEMPLLESFYTLLVDQRNLNWLPTLVSLLESPSRADSKAFVAVGALHLVGPASLPNLLREAGYQVTDEAVPLAQGGNAR